MTTIELSLVGELVDLQLSEIHPSQFMLGSWVSMGFFAHALSSKTINVLKSVMDVHWFLEWNGGKIILPTAFLPMNHQPLHPPWHGSITTYPPMIHWISAGFLWRLIPFGFHLLRWASHSFFCKIAMNHPDNSKKSKKTTYSLKIHDNDLFFRSSFPFQSSSDREMQLTGLLNAGQALFSYPTYLEVSQRCDSFWMFFGPKNGVRNNSIRLRRLLVGGFNPSEKY